MTTCDYPGLSLWHWTAGTREGVGGRQSYHPTISFGRVYSFPHVIENHNTHTYIIIYIYTYIYIYIYIYISHCYILWWYIYISFLFPVCMNLPDDILPIIGWYLPNVFLPPTLRVRRWAACCTPYGLTCGWRGCRCGGVTGVDHLKLGWYILYII